jgi:hypothetical protein
MVELISIQATLIGTFRPTEVQCLIEARQGHIQEAKLK